MHLFKTQLAARQIINSLNFLFENCDFIKDFQFFLSGVINGVVVESWNVISMKIIQLFSSQRMWKKL